MLFINYLFIFSICCASSLSSSANVIETKFGSIRGISYTFLNKNIDAYLGIPYAKPPIGNLRFTPPEPLNGQWIGRGVYNATQFSDACIQLESSLNRAPTSED